MALRIARTALTVLLLAAFAMGVWFAGQALIPPLPANPAAAASSPTLAPTSSPVSVPLPDWKNAVAFNGIPRYTALHTIFPEKPRFEVIKYTVAKGDTVWGIAEKFGLTPETVAWGNYYLLSGNIDNLSIGMELNILPVDGVYHKWSEGEGLNGVSKFYQVAPEDIINWPGNGLTAEMVGDYSHPNIPVGAMLVVPGGKRPLGDSPAAPAITRSNPSFAKYLGAGYCANAVAGTIGGGSFLWPTTNTSISGYNFSGIHPGLDFGGPAGNSVFASDSGVVVYAGWSNLGYGNLIVLDHGNGWITYYAHLNAIFVACGQGVFQGATIGTVGSTGNSTGPHLHFEMRHSEYGKVNPFDFLH